MDLTKIQSEQLKGFIQAWMKDPRLELETTFTVSDDRDDRGKPRVRGVVDSNTFRQIAQRLLTKGFSSIPQDDRLSILTPKHIRFSLEGNRSKINKRYPICSSWTHLYNSSLYKMDETLF